MGGEGGRCGGEDGELPHRTGEGPLATVPNALRGDGELPHRIGKVLSPPYLTLLEVKLCMI